MQMFRSRFWVLVLLAALVVPASRSHAQDGSYGYSVPPVDFTALFSHPRFEDGGFYAGMQFLYMRQSRPLYDQVVATRGFVDTDGSIINGNPGARGGSGQEALNTSQLSGGNYFPGWEAFAGWRFKEGVAVELSWWHLDTQTYSVSASTLPENFNLQSNLSNTVLFSPVTNFTPVFAGAAQNLGVGNPGATYGIWNAAETSRIEFQQHFDMFQVNTRLPMWMTDSYRNYAIFGPRVTILTERFRWITTSGDISGDVSPENTAIYSNVVTNKLYGAYCGTGHDWWLGKTPIGGFAISLDIAGSLSVDLVNTRAEYAIDIFGGPVVGRDRRLTTLSPGLDGRLNLWWYPWEGIQVQLGYNAMALFNTYSSRRPIDFNVGTIDPQFDANTNRYIHGLNLGIAFVF
jgi:hypothetical protein